MQQRVLHVVAERLFEEYPPGNRRAAAFEGADPREEQRLRDGSEPFQRAEVRGGVVVRVRARREQELEGEGRLGALAAGQGERPLEGLLRFGPALRINKFVILTFCNITKRIKVFHCN